MSDAFDISDGIQIGTGTRARPQRTVAADSPLSHGAALTILTFSAAIGGLGDLLLHDTPTGIGFPVWIGVSTAAFVALLWRLERAVPREPTLWLCAAILFAAGVAWRESDTLQFFDGVATIFSLLMALASVRDGSAGLFARRLRNSLAGVVSAMRIASLGILPLAFRKPLFATQTNEPRGRSRRAVRASFISGAILLVFGALLRSADPIFASLTSLGSLDVEAILGHGAVIVVLTSLVAGATRSTLLPVLSPRDGWSSLELRLEESDVTAALVTLNILFAVFVLTQLGWFFGGETFLRARTGLSAAAYAREGFFQMVLIVALVVPVLVAARASLPRGRRTDRRFASLAVPVLLLLSVMIVSALLRMRLYVNYVGLSTDRFNALAIMVWLAIVLVWFSVTVLRGWARPFVAGSVLSGLAVLAALNIAAPDEIVARVNLARATQAAPSVGEPRVDLAYLAQLSGEATPLAVRAVLAYPAAPIASAPKDLDRRDHCRAVNTLLRRWSPGSAADARSHTLGTWRSWNAGEHRAVQAVAGRYVALLKMRTICNSRI
jgi:hypothetical protein